MRKHIERTDSRSWLMIPLYFILIGGLIFLSSCGEKQEGEAPPEPEQQIQGLKAQISDLEAQLTEKEETINQLEEEKAELEKQIPEPYVVQRGDSHWELGLNFLTTEKNLPEVEAKRILANAHLLHPIYIGYKVWHYFYDGIYGTFVTQGEADVSPGAVQRIKKKEIKEEKAKLEKRIAELEKEGQELRNQIQKLEEEKAELQDQISSLENEIADLKSKNADLESKLNSVYYFADTRSNLKAKNKIKGSFLGIVGINVKEVSFSDYQNRIDLRKTDTITVSASDLGITSISKVKLLPKHLEEGVDYRVEIAGGSANVQLLNKDKFHLARIILVIN